MKRSNCYFNAALAAITALAFMAGPAQAYLHDPGGAELVPVMVLDDGLPGFALDADVVAEAAELGIDLQDADDGFILLAHAGQLSPKDDCHRWKAGGERHWHKDGTSERGGPCLTDSNGEKWKFRENDLCQTGRIRYIVVDDLAWPTSSDWKEVATELRNCIQAMPGPDPEPD